MEIIIGLIVGTLLSILIGVWLVRQQEKKNIEDEEKKDNILIELPVRKKLLDAIYNCEENLKSCKSKIIDICNNQLDLLQDVGVISHIEVKDKPLFFEYYNPITEERHFYYTRDLSNKIAPDVLANTQKVANKYNNQINLLLTQKELFERLILSHQENLNRVDGIKNQGKQVVKVKKHKDKLASLNQEYKIEEEAIYNDLLIVGINEELDHQEECLRQYIQLHKKYDDPFDDQVEEKYKIEIQEIIKQLENEDPGDFL